jgi:FlaA1/EpsC-like NDP-sugar epimerase
MRKKSDFYFKIVLVVLDIIALLSAFTIAYILRISLDPRPFHISINAMDFITSIFMTLPLWIVMFYFFGLYDREVYTHPLRNFGRILLASIRFTKAIINKAVMAIKIAKNPPRENVKDMARDVKNRLNLAKRDFD